MLQYSRRKLVGAGKGSVRRARDDAKKYDENYSKINWKDSDSKDKTNAVKNISVC